MATIREGYKLHVLDGEGVLQGTVELGGYDLDRRMSAWGLAGEILETLPAEAFKTESKTEEG